MASGASKTVLWAMGAANCPRCAAEDVENAWNAVLGIPEELRMKGYLDNLHIMQGGGAQVVKSNASSSTELGVGIGVTIATGGSLSGNASRTLDDVRDAKGTPAWDNAISKADGDFGYLPRVRQNYVKDVYDLQGAVDKMRAGGASAEEVAKYAYGARNELKVKYREYTPPDMLDVIDARNLERYGNKIGPAFDDLVKKGKLLIR